MVALSRTSGIHPTTTIATSFAADQLFRNITTQIKQKSRTCAVITYRFLIFTLSVSVTSHPELLIKYYINVVRFQLILAPHAFVKFQLYRLEARERGPNLRGSGECFENLTCVLPSQAIESFHNVHIFRFLVISLLGTSASFVPSYTLFTSLIVLKDILPFFYYSAHKILFLRKPQSTLLFYWFRKSHSFKTFSLSLAY